MAVGEITQNKGLRGKAMANALANALTSEQEGASRSKSYAKPRKK